MNMQDNPVGSVPVSIELHTHWQGILTAEKFLNFVFELKHPKIKLENIHTEVIKLTNANVPDEILNYLRNEQFESRQRIEHVLGRRKTDNPHVAFNIAYFFRKFIWDGMVIEKSKINDTTDKWCSCLDLCNIPENQEHFVSENRKHFISENKKLIMLYDAYLPADETFCDIFRDGTIIAWLRENNVDIFVDMVDNKPGWNEIIPVEGQVSIADYLFQMQKNDVELFGLFIFSESCLDYFYFCRCLKELNKNNVKYAEIQGSLPDSIPPKLFVNAMENIECNARVLSSLHHSWFAKEQERMEPEDFDVKASHLSHPFSIGIDICGPEKYLFDKDVLYDDLNKFVSKMLKLRKENNRRYVIRIHAGEGYASNDSISIDEITRARENVSIVLDVLERIKNDYELSEHVDIFSNDLEIRLGHATHIKASDHKRLKKINGIMEINLCSNCENKLDDGSKHFLRNIFLKFLGENGMEDSEHVNSVYSTDGGGCYGFTLSDEIDKVECTARLLTDNSIVDVGGLSCNASNFARKTLKVIVSENTLDMSITENIVSLLSNVVNIQDIMSFSREIFEEKNMLLINHCNDLKNIVEQH